MQAEHYISLLLNKGEILKAEKVLNEVKEKNEKLMVLERLISIFKTEVENGAEYTVFDYSTELDKLALHFNKTKLMLRRLEFDTDKRSVKEFYEYVERNRVSVYMLASLILVNIFFKKKVCMGLARLYSENKGTTSMEAVYFAKLLENIEEE